MRKSNLSRKAIIIIISCIILLIGGSFGGICVKKQNDLKNYKKFCYDYAKLDEKISKNEDAYSKYIKAIKNYVDVFTKYEGKAKIQDADKSSIDNDSTEYIKLIEELKNLNPTQEFQEDYKKLIELYEKDSIRRETINEDIKNNNGRNTKNDYITNGNNELIEFKNNFKSKIIVSSKQKGMNVEEMMQDIK